MPDDRPGAMHLISGPTIPFKSAITAKVPSRWRVHEDHRRLVVAGISTGRE
jgi:hypothetical protein